MPENIYAVIMAGGRGERFWPECRANRPKQLLNLFGNAPLIEQTVLRLQGFVPFHNILIITNEVYLERIRALLPQIPPDNIIGEPCARDTAPCVALAAGVVKAKAGSEDAVMILLPADHFIVRQQAMIADLKACAGAVAGRHAIATIGITPYAPSPNYGYIECGEPLAHSGGTFFKVRRFTEKPSVEEAERLLAQGNYKWNSGMFVFSVKTILEEMRIQAPDLHSFAEDAALHWQTEKFSAKRQEDFGRLRRISFDYAIMEHASGILVLEAGFDWDDIGNWTSLRNHYEADGDNNVVHASAELLDCKDCIVFSGDADRLIAGIDLRETVIIQTPDVTLVAPVSSTQKIKQLLEKLSAKKEKQKYL